MKRVRIRNKEFKVIPEAKLVQGEMLEKSYENDLKMGIKRGCRAVLRLCFSYVNKEPQPQRSVHANAYCNERDEWNEKTGIEVCSAKLDLKNHKKLAKQYDRVHKLLKEAARIAFELGAKHAAKAEAIEDDLVRTYGRLKV